MRWIGSMICTGLAFAAGLVGQSYSLTAEVCTTVVKCPSPQPVWGILSPTARNRVKKVVGEPFDFDKAEGTRIFGESSAWIEGQQIGLYSRLQIADFPQWVHGSQMGDLSIDPAFVHVSWSDLVTVTGASGKGYFLPVFRVRGRFIRPQHPYLTAYVALCSGVLPSGCIPQVWYAQTESSSLDTLYQGNPSDSLEFDFGTAFRFYTDCYSRILPPLADRDAILEATFNGEEKVDFPSIELQGAIISDKNGQPISGAIISSRSGVKYPALRRDPYDPQPITPSPGPAPAIAAKLGGPK
jgi:hypothetical protein